MANPADVPGAASPSVAPPTSVEAQVASNLTAADPGPAGDPGPAADPGPAVDPGLPVDPGPGAETEALAPTDAEPTVPSVPSVPAVPAVPPAPPVPSAAPTPGEASSGQGVAARTVAQNPFSHYPFQPHPVGPNPPGWYPDVEDSACLRFWDGLRWTEHRARLAVPAMMSAPTAPAVCECGVVAAGSCRVCARPYCRAHISETPTEDRAFLLRWEAWTCVHCLEDDQRAARARQLARCENVAAQIAMIPKMSRVRTITGLRPRLVNLFQRSDIAGMRPARHARAYLIEYDGGEPDSTYLGLAISASGETVFDVGAKVRGVPSARLGPKRTVRGYLIRKEITVEALREASARSTRDSWFEFASRAYLRAGKRLGIKPMDQES